MTCETCEHCKELYRRGGYGLDGQKTYLCELRDKRVERTERCDRWQKREEKKRDLLSDLSRAEGDIRALLEMCKK